MNRLSLRNFGPGASTLAPTTNEAPVSLIDCSRGPARSGMVRGSLSNELSGHTTRSIFLPARVRVRATSLLSDCCWGEPSAGSAPGDGRWTRASVAVAPVGLVTGSRPGSTTSNPATPTLAMNFSPAAGVNRRTAIASAKSAFTVAMSQLMPQTPV